MSALVLKGVVTGFILSIMIGPVFFVLLETSIRRGVKAAIAFDVGVLLSDVMYILIAYVFYSEVSALSAGESQGILKLIGGGLFLIYGVVTFFKKPKEVKVDSVGNVIHGYGDYVLLVLKGFVLNIANPLVIFYWFSVMTLGAKSTADGDHHNTSIMYFLSVILITFFSVDIMKIFGAKKLRPLVTDKLLRALNQLIGIVFAVFGVFLIIQGIQGWIKL
jgi:threonine/homoserine/homoserine lactone efflux protein